MQTNIHLTHISLASHFGDIGKQCRHRSGSTLFADMNFYQKHNKYELYTRSNKDDKSFDPESKRKKGKEHTMTSDLFFFIVWKTVTL